jgi:hypothetical protein
VPADADWLVEKFSLEDFFPCPFSALAFK